MKQATAATVAAQIAGNEAVEHAADALDEANGMQRSAGTAGRVITIGFDRHRRTAGTVGHGHIVAPHRGASGANDSIGRRVVAAEIGIGLGHRNRRQHETQSRNEKLAEPHNSPLEDPIGAAGWTSQWPYRR